MPVERFALQRIGDARRAQRLFKVAVDDRPGIGIGVEVADLARGKRVFEDVVFDASVGQCPCRIDSHRLQFARNEFHCSDAAFADAGDEGSAIRKGRPLAP